MNEKQAKWLTGCGIGCAAVVVIVVAVGFGIYFTVRGTVRDFQNVEKTVSKVEKEYGPARDFRPEPDGRIPAERVEAFLAVRKAAAGARDDFRQKIEYLESMSDQSRSRKSGFRGGMKTMRSAFGLVPAIARFYGDRANALLANRMGQGEYLYIYSLAYFSFLKKDPGDGPERFAMQGNNGVALDTEEQTENAREMQRARAAGQVHRLFRDILRNALEAEPTPAAEAPEPEAAAETRGPKKAPSAVDDADKAWRQAVEKELEALDSNWNRVPWEDGLPKEIEESLEPFRADLEASYDPIMNAMEFSQQH
jgi:hypothetical protein